MRHIKPLHGSATAFKHRCRCCTAQTKQPSPALPPHTPGGRCRHASGSCRLWRLQEGGASGGRAIGARSARHEQAGGTPRLGGHAHLLQPAVADVNLNTVQQPAGAGAERGSRWRQGQGRELRAG